MAPYFTIFVRAWKHNTHSKVADFYTSSVTINRSQLAIHANIGDWDRMKKHIQIFRYLSSEYTRGIMIKVFEGARGSPARDEETGIYFRK